MDLIENINELLFDAEIRATVERVDSLKTGGNNQVFKIRAGLKDYIVKHYFEHEEDKRCRLDNELLFLRYAQIATPQWVPKVHASSAKKRLAIYEFIDGIRYSKQMVNRDQVHSAASFFVDLNKVKDNQFSGTLPNASEACFSISGHLNIIQLRIQCLIDAIKETKKDNEALIFMNNLLEVFLNIKDKIIIKCKSQKINISESIPLSQRCISPSDFGFHNALMTSTGVPKFFDFEYAGWDDPAKMVGDFFAQISVPIEESFFEDFVRLTMSPFPGSDELVIRSYLLRPAYQIKWCCIAMNVFLPVNLSRRKFSNPLLDENELKKSQLDKAGNLLNLIRKES